MRLRIATYNILDGGEGREAKVQAVLTSLSADIVVLQEVYDNGLVPNLGAALGMEHYVGASHSSRRVAVLSRLPLKRLANHRRFPPITRSVLVSTVAVSNTRTLTVVGLHPMANLWVGFELWRWWEAN